MTALLAKRGFWLSILTVATLAVVITASRLPRVESKNLPVYGTLPDFQLTERSGTTVGLKNLQGKIWIADFIFTRCAGICPMMSSHMKLLQSELKDRSGITLVSFSVDPDHDTPDALTEYAKRFNADPKQWLFLTGDKIKLHELSQQHFHLGVSDIPAAERTTPDQTVEHSSKFVLVDQAGQIRGYYSSEEPDFQSKLLHDLNHLKES